ncbi:peptide chain release factor N(5)-glutamine methyltransferase [Ascidiimonas aurantiaca]|uniref:peptide chain release factor N(5)-glutamine methyltransferase n=1 Tax=Ascidiimonas aurantiaca TaxID=1685432 RepID=UPI0030EE1BC2
MKLTAIRSFYHQELSSLYEKKEIDRFFHILLENYTGLDTLALVLKPDLAASKEEEQLLFEALAALRLEKPIQYITGKAFFYGFDINVNQHVLIPRPETEELVDWVIKDHKNTKNTSLKILDIGTGSGCIAIALAKELPRAQVYGLDISEEALKVATNNAKQLDTNVHFIQTNILTAVSLKEQYDIIVSNPPYVRFSEAEVMKRNVCEYEPHLALFVRDNDPLVYYKKIAELAVDNLTDHGTLYLEINQYLAVEMQTLLKEKGFSRVTLARDLSGNDRMIKAQK